MYYIGWKIRNERNTLIYNSKTSCSESASKNALKKTMFENIIKLKYYRFFKVDFWCVFLTQILNNGNKLCWSIHLSTELNLL